MLYRLAFALCQMFKKWFTPLAAVHFSDNRICLMQIKRGISFALNISCISTTEVAMSHIKTGLIVMTLFIAHATFADEDISCNQALRQAQASCSETTASSSQVFLQCTKARNTCMTICKKNAETIDDVVLQDVYRDYMKTCESGEVAKKHRLTSERARAARL